MPRADNSGYTDEDTRQAEHIEDGYLGQGAPEEEAERAWDAVNRAPLATRAPRHPAAHPRRERTDGE